jgi:hypothetical protein
MTNVNVHAVDRPAVAPLSLPGRIRHDVAYFMTPAGDHGVPALGAGEYWIRREDARLWLEDGVFRLVSPLDSENKTECELTEEQELLLAWLVEHDVERIRLE